MAAFIVIKNEYCKSCRLCIEQCPYDCIEMGEELNIQGYKYVKFVNEDKCVGCALCAVVCPDLAIEVFKK